MIARWPRLVPALLLVASSILSAPPVESRDAEPPLQARESPFLYKGPEGWRQRFAPEALRDWAAAVRQHRPGVEDAPLRAIAAWPYDRVAGVIADADALATLVRQRRGQPEPGRPVRIRGYAATVRDALGLLVPPHGASSLALADLFERAAVLHTDIALAHWTAAASTDVWTESSAVSYHFGVANLLVNRLIDDGDDRFGRLWYRAMAALLHARHEVLAQRAFLESALKVTKDDPGVLLMAGTLEELLASSRMDMAPSSARGVSRQAHLREAERVYRRVLEVDAASVEARVRLARVFVQTDRPQAACDVLNGVQIEGRSAIAYFVHVVRGEALESLEHFDEARRAYLQAIEMYPQAPSGALAASHLARRQGDRAGAAAFIVRMLEFARGEAEDPWAGYFVAGDGRRAEVLLAAMRNAALQDDDDRR